MFPLNIWLKQNVFLRDNDITKYLNYAALMLNYQHLFQTIFVGIKIFLYVLPQNVDRKLSHTHIMYAAEQQV